MPTPRVVLVAIMLAAAAAAGVVRGQAQKPEKPMQVVKVKDGLVVLRGPFNRCAPNGCGAYKDDGFLHEAGDVAIRVTPQGLIVVDDKYEENAAEVLSRIQKVSRAPIRFLLNTHHHTDHAGGDALFVKTTDILAHRNVRENFLRDKLPGAPQMVFDERASVFVGNVEARAYYFGRAHTNGDAVIYFPDLKVVHTGDLITEGMPVLDYAHGASAVEWVTVLDRLLELDFDVVIPGHGALLTKERVPIDQVFDRLRLADLGWDRTVSTVAFKGGLKGYYAEMEAQLQ